MNGLLPGDRTYENWGDAIAEGPEIGVLGRITEPATQLALWHRTLPSRLTKWLDDCPPDKLPSGRISLGPEDPRSELVALFEGPAQAHSLLKSDVMELVRYFQALTKSERVEVRLEALSRNGCWRFHRDIISKRLLVTYRGPGTQMPPPSHAKKALAEQREYRGPLHNLPRGTVALFKGDPKGCGKGVLHRSPPIAETGITRLLLCLSPSV